VVSGKWRVVGGEWRVVGGADNHPGLVLIWFGFIKALTFSHADFKIITREISKH
jgi:hypothetical protein